jgi:hypothetical protein
MNRSFWILALGCLLLLGVSVAEPKAFDVVQYSGEVLGRKLVMNYADGLLDATEITVSGKAFKEPFVLRFQGGEDDSVTFVSDDDAYRFVCKLDGGEEPPQAVSGELRFGGTTHRFLLRRE